MQLKNLITLSFLCFGLITAKTQTCTRAFRIVVLGSSTAYGDGTTDSTKAWVYLYTSYLQTINPGYVVKNLAVPGTTTYAAQDNDYNPPKGRPTPLKGHNITAALNLDPDAIIINYPSNDVTEGFSLAEQEANFKRVTIRAANHGILVWVATPQPRDNLTAAQVVRQDSLYDWITSYYGAKSIDFHTGFATDVDSLDHKYDSGDGIHLNDPGHKKLYNRVVKEHIPDSLCNRNVPVAILQLRYPFLKATK